MQEKQTEAELSDLRVKFLNDLTAKLNDLTAKDENKKVLAEIGLAGHGLAAIPVVSFALGVEQVEIRSSAVNVFYRMFQASIGFAERDALLTELMNQMMSPNKNLRTGIVQSLVKVGPLLNPAEHRKVITFLESKVPPRTFAMSLKAETWSRKRRLSFGLVMRARFLISCPLLRILDAEMDGCKRW